MSKRSVAKSAGQNISTNSKKSKHWSWGLVQTTKDPDQIVKQTDKLVVIRDKYPKSRIHYLILTHEDISNIYKLDRSHVSLLQEFGTMYENLKEEHGVLRAGFHAIPSMERIHMHVISTDMISPCLKTKVHWNSFTTKFFLPYEDVLKELKENGFVKRISHNLQKDLMSRDLKCNQCSYKPKNMPQLKEHLLSHDKP